MRKFVQVYSITWYGKKLFVATEIQAGKEKNYRLS